MRFFLIAATLLALGTSAHAEVNVRIASVADQAEKAGHIALVKRSLRALNVPSIDVVVTKLDVRATGEVIATVEAILSGNGGIRSIASGKASFVAPKHQLGNQAQLRKEALGYALEALHRKVRSTARPVS
jgi:hypothetical protein